MSELVVLKYCCTLKNKQRLYRNYCSDKEAANQFKLLAIKFYSSVADISAKDNGKWRRVAFR
jgi:hypothetical protein